MRHAVSSKRLSIALLLLLAHAGLAYAEKLAELSDDFLEYLGSLEGEDENWADFKVDAAVALTRDSSQNAAKSAASSSSASKASSAVSASSDAQSSVQSSAASKTTANASGKAER